MENTTLNEQPSITLNDGTLLPAVGFGTYRLNGKDGAATMAQALRSGYLLLDSAFNYENEGALGQALRTSGVSRDKIRIASKLPGRHHRYQEALLTIEESVYRTGVDHFDFYLIHWPNPDRGRYVEAWRALIEARQRGLVRSIGVCNFLPEHIDRIVDETGVVPCVNQIEMHPYFPQEKQRAYNASKGIATEAWSPLGRAGTLLNEPALQRIAEAHRVDVGQVVLRWHHQLGAVPLPKATTTERQLTNLAIFDFELGDEQMASIAQLAQLDGRLAHQDPTTYEEM